MPDTKGTALITGASSGIGETFARKLAARGYDVVLVARRKEKLEALAAELTKTHGVKVDIVAADLIRPEDVERVCAAIRQRDDVSMLVNNAGFGTMGHFADVEIGKQIDMIQVHTIATEHLTHAALPGMIARGQGGIINVASMAAFLPMPNSVTYSGTKAFLVAFSEALHKEVSSKGVHVEALCPGLTYTEFHDAPEFKQFKRTDVARFLWLTADQVVEESLRALERGKVVWIPGRRYRIMMSLWRSPLGKLLMRLLAKKRWSRD